VKRVITRLEPWLAAAHRRCFWRHDAALLPGPDQVIAPEPRCKNPLLFNSASKVSTKGRVALGPAILAGAELRPA